MSTIRIAIATPSRNAWSETFIAAHLQRVKEVVLVLTDGSPPQQDGDGVQLLPNTFSLALRRHISGMDRDRMLKQRIARSLRRKGVQVVLAEYGKMGEAMLESCQWAGIPLVVHFHGYDAHETGNLERHANYRRILKGAAAFVVVSRAMEEQLLRLGAPREKLFYNGYGIDTGRFKDGSPDKAPPHFLAVGRFVEKKAPLLTLLAFNEVLRERPEARLTMVGAGVLWESALQVIRGLGLQGKVELCGVRDPDEVALLMRNSRAFVQHSVITERKDQEGTPLAVLEAMASGLPVIATRHAGIGDVVVDGQSGLLCEEFDIGTMASHMTRLMDDPAMAERMGKTGRLYVNEHHRIEDSIAGLQAILEQTVRRI